VPEPRPIRTSDSGFHLQIRNRATRPLRLAIFNLASGGPIGRVDNEAPLTVEPAGFVELRMVASLPAGYDHGADVLKLLGTLAHADFEWLSLPALGQAYTPKRATRSPSNPLEALLHEPAY